MISESSTQLSLLLDVAIALGLGGLLGLEREWKHQGRQHDAQDLLGAI